MTDDKLTVVSLYLFYFRHRDRARQLRRSRDSRLREAGRHRLPSRRQAVLRVSARLRAGGQEEHNLPEKQPVVREEAQLRL